MRLLVVSNVYPPHYLGGYELRCAQVAEALQEAGHQVRVLTSDFGLRDARRRRNRHEPPVFRGVSVDRGLNQYAYGPQPAARPWTLFQARREVADARLFLQHLESFRPEVVSWWSMNGLAKTLLPIPARQGIPDVHWIEHPWMIREYGPEGEIEAAFWKRLWDGPWGSGSVRALLREGGRLLERRLEHQGIPVRHFPNRPAHMVFVSEYLRGLYRDAGLEFPSSEVIHGGVPVERFYQPRMAPPSREAPLRLLYAGQISPDRGLHTAVEALGRLDPALQQRVTLSIAGSDESGYLDGILERARELGLGERVEALGSVAHDAMAKTLAAHDVLVFTSTRPEGLPLVMVEAMLAGCAVLTTGSGGAMEVATAAELPLFPKEDPSALARLLQALIEDREEVFAIARRGQEVARREFSFDGMMQRWTATLDGLARQGRPSRR